MTETINRDMPIMMETVKKIHFVGIGGVGMCGIAEVLLSQGYQISGSDRLDSSVARRLRSLGADVHVGHATAHIDGADVVVKSSAVSADNAELHAAAEQGIPIVLRAQMLAELMRGQYGIAIAGTHGKTTTTSLVTSVLTAGDLDPGFVIGGKLNSAGVNARSGGSRYFVVEADESDASFLHLQPIMAVVTNIGADHMETYNNDFACLQDAFLAFLHALPFYGVAVICIDDPVINEMLPIIAAPVMTYGFSEQAQIRAVNWQQNGLQSCFTVQRYANFPDLQVVLNMPGEHNVLNALAAIAIATKTGVADQAICTALAKFAGVGRRFQIYGELAFDASKVLLVDDYGHHPCEVTATIQAARQAWPERRLLLAFQPHRYSRVQMLFDDFAKALAAVDVLLILDIYPAGEIAIPGIDSRALCQRISQLADVEPVYVGAEENLENILPTVVQDGDVLLMQGAGSIGKLVLALAEQYKIEK